MTRITILGALIYVGIMIKANILYFVFLATAVIYDIIMIAMAAKRKREQEEQIAQIVLSSDQLRDIFKEQEREDEDDEQ